MGDIEYIQITTKVIQIIEKQHKLIVKSNL